MMTHVVKLTLKTLVEEVNHPPLASPLQPAHIHRLCPLLPSCLPREASSRTPSRTPSPPARPPCGWQARLATYGRGGFEQLQIDCAMLRWVLPTCVDDDGDVLALLDETLTSCQERCVDVAAVDHSVLEGLCERKRQQLLLALG